MNVFTSKSVIFNKSQDLFVVLVWVGVPSISNQGQIGNGGGLNLNYKKTEIIG